MTSDPYAALGVQKNAKPAEIKSAFRKLAKAYHPDQSKHPAAKEKFSEINTAYEILCDAKKRAAFDRGEIDADGKPRAPQFDPRAHAGQYGRGTGAGFSSGNPFGTSGDPFQHFEFSMGTAPNQGSASRRATGFGGFDPSDIFADIFGGNPASNARARAQQEPPPKPQDIVVPLVISLPLAVKGGTARLTLPNGKTVELKIPAGTVDGQQIRLRGQGEQQDLRTGAKLRTDVIASVKLAPHLVFRIEERDVRLDLPITLYEAVLGGKVMVPTLDGAVEMSLPQGGNVGRVLRLRGKGLPATTHKGVNLPAGDLLVVPRIVLPEGKAYKHATNLETLMRQWRDEHPYDPRASILG